VSTSALSNEVTVQGTGHTSAPIAESPSIDRIAGLIPGFVYVFSHVTYSNTYTNRSVAEYLGYCSEEIRAFGDQVMKQIIHPEDHHLLGAHMVRIAQLGADEIATLEYRVLMKNGAERWLRSVDAVFDRAPDGTLRSHIGCASDITVEKQGELRLAELNAELESKVVARTHALADLNAQLEERIIARTHQLQDTITELEQLAYVANHDLKVPVNNLSRLGTMLAQSAQDLNPEQIEQVAWINDCANQLRAKIQGLILVAQIRLSSGVNAETLNLREEVAQTVKEIGPVHGLEPLAVTGQIPPDLNVHFPRYELRSILATLFENAVKYADAQRQLEINISAARETEHVVLRVRDNGTGIDETHDVPKVFGLFQRAHKTPAGSGVSLYCACRILRRLGGAISVRGARGEGTEFTIKIPIERGVS